MTTELKKIECPCGFAVQGHDEREVVDLVRNHAKKSHNHDLSESELRQAMRSVEFTPQ
jgi:predicted small metal-binding protein